MIVTSSSPYDVREGKPKTPQQHSTLPSRLGMIYGVYQSGGIFALKELIAYVSM